MYTDLINNKINYSFSNPKTIVPIPKETDYENGFIQRYYCQKINDLNGFIFEIDNNLFKELENNPFWKTTILRWRIKGPINPVYNDVGQLIDMGVIQSNKNSIVIASFSLKNIGLYLPNILQFHK
jgi:hypothetical protein